MHPEELEAYLADSRQLALEEVRRIVPANGRYRSALYDLMLEYPLRASKGLRPALCIATCRALGGSLEGVLRSAAALELYHNAFLIHDDVEDGSETRRGEPTLQSSHGAAVAMNVGDAMLALSLRPLLDNLRVVGLGKALRILQVVQRMACESAEGQALELDWIRQAHWDLTDADYVRMVFKKTSWYTVITPVTIGAIVADLERERLRPLRSFAALLGIAFQIQDDVLNLRDEHGRYGKEIAGDLWEGKHTLIALHMMRSATPADRERALAIFHKPRPRAADRARGVAGAHVRVRDLLAQLQTEGNLSPTSRERIEAALAERSPPHAVKTEADVDFLKRLIERHGSIDHARAIARRFARRAKEALDGVGLAHSVHADFLEALAAFVVDRGW